MGLNDAGEMLEVAKAENLRLERELEEANGAARIVTGLYVSAEQEVKQLLAERDRARATAVRLEQELAQVAAERDALAEGVAARDAIIRADGAAMADALAEVRRTKGVCE